MKFIQVESSTIDAVKHDNKNQVLTVRFVSGTEYEYDGVQQDTTICLNFNKPVTSVNELEYLNLSINISDVF